MTDSAGSPPTKSKRRPGRRWKMVLAALVLAGLAATWQQGLLEDGLNEVRRYDSDPLASIPPESAVSGDAPLEPAVGGLHSFPEDWAFGPAGEEETGDDDQPATEETEPFITYDPDDQDRNRVLAQTETAVLRAGSTTGVESTDIVMVPLIASDNTVETAALLGDGVDISTDALVEEGVFILTLTLPDEPAPDAIPGVWHVSDSDQGQLIPGVWNIDDNTITIEVRGFSRFWGGWWNPINWIYEATDYVTDFLTGRTDFPPCKDDAHEWLSVTMSELSSVHVCDQAADPVGERESVQILIKSNRSTIQMVTFPRSAHNLWVQGQSDWIQPLFAHLMHDGPEPSDTSVVLFGGESMAYDLSQQIVDVDLHTSAYQTDTQILLNMLLSLIGGLDISEALSVALSVRECASRLVNVDMSEITGSFDYLAHVEPLMWCIVDLLGDPDRAASLAESSARLARLSDDVALRAGDWIRSTLNTGRMKGVAGVMGRVTWITSNLTFAWDVIFDSIADGSLFLSLKGDESLWASQFRDDGVDFDEIEATTGETPVMLVADTSGSMGEYAGNEVKLDAAKSAMLMFLDTVSSTREVALRSYPVAGWQDCNSGELKIAFEPKRPEMRSIILGLEAGGNTPTAEALRTAVDDIVVAGFTQAEIALFSDGLVNCDDPCLVANEIAGMDVEIRVHIGAFVDTAAGREALECISEETGGSYTEGSDAATDFAGELVEFLARNSTPRLKVDLQTPEGLSPSADPSEPDQYVEAVVRNDSNVAAKGVVLNLDAGDGRARTRRSFAIGNVAPGSESTVVVSLRPGFNSVGTDVAIGLSATALNTDEVSTASGAVAVEDPNVADEAGPILGVGQIVVMGDQLLSGVGTSTRGPYGGCRRSRNIGLLEVFGQPAERSLACANALMAHLAAPDWAKDVDSQINQLVDLREGEGAISAVVLSIGATDFGLSELTRECVMSNVPCDSEIAGVPTEEWLGESVAGGGPRHAAASAHLVRALGTVDEALNQTRDRSRGTRQVPILLLAQPRAFPFVHGACFERWQGEDLPLMTQPELNLYHHFVSVVNGTLEAAAVASQDLGLPVFYVDTTESAYLPDHTACSAEPYVQSLEPLVEAGSRVIKTLSEGGVAAVAGGEFNEDTLVELGEEFLVPNEYGEQALANAVLRWSQSDEAQEADDFVSDEFQRRSAGIAPRVSEPTVGETRTFSQPGRAAIEPGRGWTASTSGFLPGALVTASLVPGERVVASAVADENGTAELYVAVPRDIAAGDVTLVARGVSRSGEAISVEQPARILPPLRPIHSVALPALAVLLLLSSVGLWRASRRTVTVAAPLRDES